MAKIFLAVHVLGSLSDKLGNAFGVAVSVNPAQLGCCTESGTIFTF